MDHFYMDYDEGISTEMEIAILSEYLEWAQEEQ